MKTFLIIDTWNLLARAKFASKSSMSSTYNRWAHNSKDDIQFESIGYCLHFVLTALLYAVKKFNPSHIVFACEGKSWRYAIYEPYKRNRKELNALKTDKEKEDDKLMSDAFNEFITFLDMNTNVTVIRHKNCEADDMIAGWVLQHKNDKNIIISGDTDFIQLLDENTVLWDGVNRRLYTDTQIINESLKKTGKNTENESLNPKYELFKKIIRGDSSDNIFSAYPKVRETNIKKAFADMHTKGYEWNNFMLARWQDHNGIEHQVKDCYNRNEQLIDLTKQPDDIKVEIEKTVVSAQNLGKQNKNIGFAFLKFCGKYELNEIGKNSKEYIDFLSKKY